MVLPREQANRQSEQGFGTPRVWVLHHLKIDWKLRSRWEPQNPCISEEVSTRGHGWGLTGDMNEDYPGLERYNWIEFTEMRKETRTKVRRGNKKWMIWDKGMGTKIFDRLVKFHKIIYSFDSLSFWRLVSAKSWSWTSAAACISFDIETLEERLHQIGDMIFRSCILYIFFIKMHLS